MRIKTGRLLLRNFEEKDLPQMLDYLGDPDVTLIINNLSVIWWEGEIIQVKRILVIIIVVAKWVLHISCPLLSVK